MNQKKKETKKRSIAGKITVGILTLTLSASLIIGAAGIVGMSILNNSAHQVYTNDLKPLDNLFAIVDDVAAVNTDMRDIALKQGDESSLKGGINSAMKDISSQMSEYSGELSDDGAKKDYQAISSDLQDFTSAESQFIVDYDAGNVSKAETLLNDSATKNIDDTVSNAFMSNIQQANQDDATATTLFFIILALVIVVIVVFVVLSLLRSRKISSGISDPIAQMVKAADEVSGGNLDVEVDISTGDETEVLAGALGRIITALRSMQAEAEKLAMAGLEGQLDVRGDVSQLKGVYAQIVDGVNQTLESIVTPLNESGAVLGKMAQNDYTLNMAGNYRGMLKDLADSVNEVQERLLDIQKGFIEISTGDASSLETYKKIGRRSENDRMTPAMVKALQAVSDLIEDSASLAHAAAVGDLSARGDVGKLEGGYRDIIEGMNRTMEAFAKPIEEASNVLGEFAQGNLTVSMTGEYAGEYDRIKQALNRTISSFNELMGEISNAATQVSTGSKQVSDGSQSLAQGAAEQASSVEELTSSIADITQSTRGNAEKASEAKDLSYQTKAEAEQGNGQMKLMLESMEQIGESSANISKIIKVIDDIAFQTNILALNAAVEAARAGQYGKGFAVVAEEVRNLAAKSAEAAKETTALIEGSVAKVQSGSRIANETAEKLDTITRSIDETAELVGSIAIASNDQATALNQVTQGVEQVSAVIQMNSATAEESAASSEELSGQADLLSEMVGRFMLSGEPAPSFSERLPAARKAKKIPVAAGFEKY